MSVHKTILESVDLDNGGSISIYKANTPRIAITISYGHTEYCIWVTPEEAEALNVAVNKVLKESE